MYDIDTIAYQNSTTGMFLGVNTAMNGFFGLMILLSIFLMLFITLLVRGNNVSHSFAATSFITAIVCLFMWTLRIANDYTFFATLFVLGMSVLFLFFNEQ